MENGLLLGKKALGAGPPRTEIDLSPRLKFMLMASSALGPALARPQNGSRSPEAPYSRRRIERESRGGAAGGDFLARRAPRLRDGIRPCHYDSEELGGRTTQGRRVNSSSMFHIYLLCRPPILTGELKQKPMTRYIYIYMNSRRRVFSGVFRTAGSRRRVFDDDDSRRSTEELLATVLIRTQEEKH